MCARCVTPYSTWKSRIIAEVFHHCDAILLTSCLTFIYHQYFVINESNRRMVWILRTNSICAYCPKFNWHSPFPFAFGFRVWMPLPTLSRCKCDDWKCSKFYSRNLAPHFRSRRTILSSLSSTQFSTHAHITHTRVHCLTYMYAYSSLFIGMAHVLLLFVRSQSVFVTHNTRKYIFVCGTHSSVQHAYASIGVCNISRQTLCSLHPNVARRECERCVNTCGIFIYRVLPYIHTRSGRTIQRDRKRAQHPSWFIALLDAAR